MNTIVKRDGTLAGYDRRRIATAILKAMVSLKRGGREQADAIAAKVESALLDTYGDSQMPSVEDIQDVVENVLLENHLFDIARAYIIYRHERAMARAARAHTFEVTDNVPYRKLYEVLRWNMDHGCESVPDLNRIIRNGDFPELVRAADRRFDDEIAEAAARILEARDRVRMVIVAGPSSSGKTTTMQKLSQRLIRAGVNVKAINIDNYFFELERHPRDEFGDYDYETPQALDLALINSHLEQLLAGRAVLTPHYDFKTGRRVLDVHEFDLGRGEILLIDSLHGLYEGMTDGVPTDRKFKLYIETLGQFKTTDGTLMRWADNRLLRRMIRDKAHRNLGPMETLAHWHYVRRSELQHIIPFIKHADTIVNSALPYELAVLKPKIFRYVSQARNRFREDPRRLDAHIRANRLYDLLRPLKPVRDDSCVPRDSLLREFIGGSSFSY